MLIPSLVRSKIFPLFSALLLSLAPLAAVSAEPKETDRTPGKYDGLIASEVVKIMQQYHFDKDRRKFTAEKAQFFLDTYLKRLDNQHIFFLASDIKQFQSFVPELNRRIPGGDISLAHRIFGRFMQRLEANYKFANALLNNGTFEFTGDDRYLVNRKDAAHPKNKAEQQNLWKQRLRYEYLQEKLGDQEHDEIVETLKRRYTRIRRYFRELDGDDVLEHYLASLTRAYDPHSDYMAQHSLDNFAISMKLSLQGIGALLSSPDGTCEIVRVIPGGPAARSKKLKAKDKIVAVAQADEEPVDVVDMPLRKVVDLIRGEKGTEVRLTVIPADASDSSVRKQISLIRDEIPLENQEASAKLIEMKDSKGKQRRLGVIDLPSFYADFNLDNSKKKKELKSTSKDVAALLKRLKKENIEGLVLDLRRNGGGSLDEAIKLSGLFMQEGPVVLVKDLNGQINVDRDPDKDIAYDGPMIVLTSRHSASASEILAGALQDHDRALIVGEKSTHGKGTVQTLLELERFYGRNSPVHGLIKSGEFKPGALKITIRKFYRPSCHSTQKRGVVPDIVLPSVNNWAEGLGEAQLENPMDWDFIPKETLSENNVALSRMDRAARHVETLRKLHKKRTQSDQDFAYIREDIERYKELIKDKTVSLNEAERIKEKEDNEARVEKRKTEIRSRPEPDVLSYKFTLKNLEEEGLPEAIVGDEEPEDEEEEVEEEPDSDEKGEEEEEKLPVIDAGLKETRLILLDYIDLVSKKGAVASTQSK